ncbi:hypothetical protein ACLOJK_018043 [Asimina triloba]
MGTLLLPIATSLTSSFPKCPCAITTMPLTHLPLPKRRLSLLSQIIIAAPQRLRNARWSVAAAAEEEEGDDEAGNASLVQPLRVPEQWLHPSQALQVSFLFPHVPPPVSFISAFCPPACPALSASVFVSLSADDKAGESEWLRVTLHKWLDDEYCPEPTNIEISKVAALSYYESLVEKHADLGEILLKMATDLESISYKESFHGAFSSANAAVSLIAQRMASSDDEN